MSLVCFSFLLDLLFPVVLRAGWSVRFIPGSLGQEGWDLAGKRGA